MVNNWSFASKHKWTSTFNHLKNNSFYAKIDWKPKHKTSRRNTEHLCDLRLGNNFINMIQKHDSQTHRGNFWWKWCYQNEDICSAKDRPGTDRKKIFSNILSNKGLLSTLFKNSQHLTISKHLGKGFVSFSKSYIETYPMSQHRGPSFQHMNPWGTHWDHIQTIAHSFS